MLDISILVVFSYDDDCVVRHVFMSEWTEEASMK